jgi:hypothetical protein
MHKQRNRLQEAGLKVPRQTSNEKSAGFSGDETRPDDQVAYHQRSYKKISVNPSLLSCLTPPYGQ